MSKLNLSNVALQFRRPIRLLPCTIPGCRARQKARGWCSRHYSRWKRTGNPETSSRHEWSEQEDRLVLRHIQGVEYLDIDRTPPSTWMRVADLLGRSPPAVRTRAYRLRRLAHTNGGKE